MSQTRLNYKIRKHAVTRPLNDLKEETENVSRSYPKRSRTSSRAFKADPIDNSKLSLKENNVLFSPVKENRDKSPGKRLCVDPPASPDSVSPNKRSKVQFGTPTKRKPFTCITPIKTPTKTPTQTRSKRFTPCCENIIITSPIKTPVKTPVKSIKLSDKTPLFFSPHKSPYTPLTPTNTPGPASPASPNASRKTPTKIIKTPTKAGFKSPYKQKKVICNPAASPRALFPNEVARKKGRLSALSNAHCSPALRGAKKLMQSCSTPDRLVGRDAEVQTLQTYLETRLKEKQPGSLYVSGAPGTGKSASITTIMTKLEKEHSFTSLTINCMTHGTPRLLYGEIAASLNCPKLTPAACTAEITAKGKKKMIIIVLDEIDQLESTGQTVLYTLFEWPALANSRLILIGIANSLDLTDRALPRLQAKVSCQPTLLHFTPYTKDQIVNILKDRLKEIPNIDEVMDQAAIQFCARKVSAITGDIRKALDICRRAIELVECKQRSSETPLKVTLPFISRVIQEVYGSKVTNQLVSKNAESTLPLQQQLLLCSVAMATAKKHGNKLDTVTLGKLHAVTTKVCEFRGLSVIGFSELVDMCSALESRGLILLKKAKDKRQQKVSLQLQPSELEHALQDKTLLSSIMDNSVKFIR